MSPLPSIWANFRSLFLDATQLLKVATICLVEYNGYYNN